MSCVDGKCYKVDPATDNLAPGDLAKHCKLVEEANRKELQRFVDNRTFKLIHVDSVDADAIEAVRVC